MGDEIDGAAPLHARRPLRIEHVHRNAHADLGPYPQPQKIHVHRQILHRIELEVARNDPMLGAIDVELVDRGEEAPRIDAAPELFMLDRDAQRGFVVAIDDAGHAAGPALGPRRPLAGARAHRRLHLLDSRHDPYPLGASLFACAATEKAALAAIHRRPVAKLRGRGSRALITGPRGIDKETGKCRRRGPPGSHRSSPRKRGPSSGCTFRSDWIPAFAGMRATAGRPALASPQARPRGPSRPRSPRGRAAPCP